jgi:hypothetical protein
MRLWVALAAIVTVVAGCSKLFGPGEYTVDKAAKKEYVSVAVEASSEKEAAITLHVRPAGAGSFTVIVPAGTKLANTRAGGQSLVTARTVQFAFVRAASGATQTQRVETYCLNRFLDFPKPQTAMRLELDGDEGEWETNPVRRLVACLEKSTARYEDRQFAVWMVSEGLLDRSRSDVLDLYRRKLGARIEHKLRLQLYDEGLELVRGKFPGVADEELRRLVNEFAEEDLPRRIEATLRDEVEAYAAKAGPVLRACAYAIDGKRFFAASAVQLTRAGGPGKYDASRRPPAAEAQPQRQTAATRLSTSRDFERGHRRP